MKATWPRLSLPFHAQATAWLDQHVLALRTAMVNCYLYRRDDVLLAFDAGMSLLLLERALNELDQDGAQAQAVFLTHGDSDHIGGLGLFPHAAIYVGAGEESLITGQQRRMRMNYEPLQTRGYTSLEDGDHVSVGGVDIQAIATPGHTPGSTSYLVDGGYLFVGDTLSLRRDTLAPFVRIINMDHPEQLRSIAKLANLQDVRLLCTGHSGVSRNWQSLTQPWRGEAT